MKYKFAEFLSWVVFAYYFIDVVYSWFNYDSSKHD